MADTAPRRPESQVPPRCPACGRLTVDNAKHCPDDPKKPGLWARRCLTIVCRCGGLYRAGAHYAPPKPPDPPGRRPPPPTGRSPQQ